jgi:hypothetical protein
MIERWRESKSKGLSLVNFLVFLPLISLLNTAHLFLTLNDQKAGLLFLRTFPNLLNLIDNI